MTGEHITGKDNTLGNDIDLLDMLIVIWKRKWFIIAGTLIVTLIAAMVSLLLPKVYKSTGFVNAYWPYRDIKEEDVKLKKVDLDEFGFRIETAESKKIIKLVKNKDLFRRFLRLNRDRLGLGNQFFSSLDSNLDNSVKMIYAIDQSKKKAEIQNNFVVGFQLTALGDNPQKVEKLILVLKEYISRIIINNEIVEYTKINLNWEKYKLTKNKSRIINHRYDLSKLKEREELLYKLAKEFPEMNNSSVVISTSKNKAFQTPLQQLVSTKIEIADMNEWVDRILREDIITRLRLDLLVLFNKLIAENPQVLIVFNMVEKARDVFSKYLVSINDENSEFLQMVKSDFEDKLGYFEQLDNYVLRLATAPSLPGVPISPKKKTIVIFAFFIGALFFTLISFFVEAFLLRKKNS